MFLSFWQVRLFVSNSNVAVRPQKLCFNLNFIWYCRTVGKSHPSWTKWIPCAELLLIPYVMHFRCLTFGPSQFCLKWATTICPPLMWQQLLEHYLACHLFITLSIFKNLRRFFCCLTINVFFYRRNSCRSETHWNEI